jgi:outer membrane immunogenic protein
MKKIIFLAVLIVGIGSASSLKAQFSIGPGVLYGTQIEQLGLSANASYDFMNKIGVMADYTYFFKKNSFEWWTLDLDGTYTFLSMGDLSRLYALAGINMLYYTYPALEGLYSSSGSKSYTGINIGAGWKIGMGKKIHLIPEVRYTFVSVGSASGYARFGVKLMFGL